ncbi:MAG: hypothetical protein QOE05_2913 [Actinomycetota bacterium]|jgi:hypothetical protein|nr:hypothetical protein [Actinomycetota bacterium]
MTDHLPGRRFTPLPPPPAGAATAVRDGRGIRRRRRLAGAGAAAASVVLVAGVALAASGASTHAKDELVPADPDVPSLSIETPPDSDDRTADALTVSTARPSPTAAARPSPSSAAGTRPAGPSPAATRHATTSGYRTPTLIRRYRAAATPTGGPSGRICSGGGEGDTNGNLSNGYGFCVAGYAVTTARGHDLILEVCRDSTGPGSLRFPRELEADLVVHDTSDRDRAVWRWSTGHPNDEDVHVLKLETSACWTWTAPWTDVDARGRQLDPGSYAVAVSSPADQLRGIAEQRAAFRIS